ncbi:holo-ACP synthase [Phocea massiliensis]|uniref:Holo-[acyl-carrier-protein] synthase n=1 Tax=Merdimmobilis hominis TaxID=2897707 RepID=A0A939BEV3_9FIRM|nr:holo-ACP synthase [Merdimmobilis hominis]MBM6921296.1 holo-ACP synthase [Merdimmobilis hominis]
MIAGVGIDCVQIVAIEKSLASPRFVERFFGKEEQLLFVGAHRTERIAAHFAAKEAFSKAMGSGVRGFLLCEVEVLRDELGAPYLKLSGNAQTLAAGKRLFVSLSHTSESAQAIVIAEFAEE